MIQQAAIAAFLFLSFPAFSQSPETAAQKLDSIFSVYTNQTPGAAVAIVKDGRVVFKKGYGMADLEQDKPITPQTVFNIASVSKQFTAFAIYLLESEGRLSFEDDIRKYISELPAYSKPIRIRHLLSHTSGLRDQWALLGLAGWRQDDVFTTEQILKLLARQKELNHVPGTTFSYCNSGYTLLAEIVRRVSGRSFADYTREKIFTPLGMTNTRFYDNHESLVKNRAQSYERVGNTYYLKPINVSTAGPSNLMTTVEDLTKWVLNFENPVVGNAKMIQAFNEPSCFDDGKKVVMRIFGPGDSLFQAKGQNLGSHKGVPMITHGGHTAGFRTFMGRFPGQRLAIIALSNDEHNERLNARWQLADYYIKDHLQEEPAASPAATVPKPAPAPPLYTTGLRQFEGDYHNDELLTSYSIEVRNDLLVMTHMRLPDLVLKRTGENRFSGSGSQTFPFELEFLKSETGTITGFLISNFGVKNMLFAKKGR